MFKEPEQIPNPALPAIIHHVQTGNPPVDIISANELPQFVIAAVYLKGLDYETRLAFFERVRQVHRYARKEIAAILRIEHWFATLQNQGRLKIKIRRASKKNKSKFTKRLPHSYAFVSRN